MFPLRPSRILTQFPDEVIEAVVILLARHPSAIASLSRTCRTFYSLIYSTRDQHLWRRVYLERFDDPRQSRHLRLHQGEDIINWGTEYRKRSWAIGFLKASSTDERIYRDCSNIPYFGDTSSPTGSDPRAEAWKTLVSLVNTAPPIQRNALDVDNLPLDPSLSLSLVSKQVPRLPQLSERPDDFSNNIREFLDVFRKDGIPFPLSRRIASNHIDRIWDKTQEAQAFYQYMAYMGYTDPYNIDLDGSVDPDHREARANIAHDPTRPAKAKRIRKFDRKIRWLAMRRIYDITYPSEETLSGPLIKIDIPLDNPSIPPSCFFSPDWAHLAAIRQEVQGMLFREYNLRQPFYPTITSSEHQTLRAGWWTPPCPPAHPPQLLDERFRDPQVGWDWAGVEGIWWRLVVWLGWGVLSDFNTTNFEMLTGMPHHKLVPMRLRVTEYDYGNSAISSRFPRIFFEGETGGESWTEDAEEMGDVPDVRLITGNVSMLIDGNVRWSMDTCHLGDNHAVEWISEGIQIGGVGSMAGILGLWTGSTQMDDPVGGWWQWRVA